MSSRSLPGLALLVLLAPPVAGDEPGVANYVSQLGGELRSAIVSGDQLEKSPPWSPESNQPPPVSIKDAVELSREVVHALVTDSEVWRLEEVRFEKVSTRWLYVVRWEPSTGARKDYLQIPVLLSGRVILLSPKGISEERR